MFVPGKFWVLQHSFVIFHSLLQTVLPLPGCLWEPFGVGHPCLGGGGREGGIVTD